MRDDAADPAARANLVICGEASNACSYGTAYNILHVSVQWTYEMQVWQILISKSSNIDCLKCNWVIFYLSTLIPGVSITPLCCKLNGANINNGIKRTAPVSCSR